MHKLIVMEELHITLSAPVGLRKADYTGIQRTLRGRRFVSQLRRAILSVVRFRSSLASLKVTIGR